MKRNLLIGALMLMVFGTTAQNHGQPGHDHAKCGADIVLQQQLQDPQVRAEYEAFQEAALRYAADPRVAVKRENGKRIIPVVFHILHEGGSENISRDRVLTQMEVLNQDFNRLNPDTVNTPERFYGDTEYTHFTFTGDAIESFLDDSAYIRLHNVSGTSFAFHFNDGNTPLNDSLVDNFDNVVDVNISSNPDTADLASALANSIDAQPGLNAVFTRDTTYFEAPNFLVDGAEVSELSYTTEHTFTTSWNGSDTDTTYSDTLTVVLFENASDPFEPTDTLEVFPADVTYDVFDTNGDVVSTETFTEEGFLELEFTTVAEVGGDFRVEVSTNGLGYVEPVLLAGYWNMTSTIVQTGSYIPANSNIEFRLATLDPMGNCTDGVVRVFTSKTNDANDGTGFKAESYWSSFKYLNVWVVRSISVRTDGFTLGYAQFPCTGLPSTDGITVIAPNINQPDFGGRTATHEVGHWLNLRHVWGDALCGSDDVLDTPTAEEPNFGICGNHPTLDPNVGGGSTYFSTPYNVPGCDPDNPDGEMFMNYMDYSPDACQNTFTLGQKARMDFVLEGDGTELGCRSFLVSEQNLQETGVADPYEPSECAPISDFYFQQGSNFATTKMICEGEDVRFFEAAYNGEIEEYDWAFDGGDPETSTSSNPQIDYNTPGTYDVTLTVSNDQGADTRTAEAMVIVSSNEAQFQNNWGYVESFWSEEDFLSDYVVFNQDGSDNKWEWFNGVDGGSTGDESARMFNFENRVSEVDELISPSYDLSTLDNPTLKFRYSGAAYDNTPEDELEIRFSDNCGESWGAPRLTLSDFELTNSGLVSESYRPNASSVWTDVTVNPGASVSNSSNVRVMFRWISGGRGNNFYIDDITFSSGPIGMEDLERITDLKIAPNPTLDMTAVSMNLADAAHVRLELVDMLGRDVQQLYSSEMGSGQHRFDVDLSSFDSGVYFLRIHVDKDMMMRKVVKN